MRKENGADEMWQQLTAPLCYGAGSANINSCAINKQGVFRQVSASNPPQRKAAKRCRHFI